jgi:hypothetical protein
MKKYILLFLTLSLIPSVSFATLNYSRSEAPNILTVSVKADTPDDLIESYCASTLGNNCGNLQYWEIVVTQISGFDSDGNPIYKYYESPAYSINDLNESYSFLLPTNGNYNLIQIGASPDNLLNSDGILSNNSSLLTLESSGDYTSLFTISDSLAISLQTNN